VSSDSYMGIPREKIPWFPTIDPEKCTNCGACKDFCSNGVFALGETVMEVVQPLNCVVGCRAYTRECPADAISFPADEELVKTLRELREKCGPKKSGI